jgi:nucleoside-diphosphate-sugar epimerase
MAQKMVCGSGLVGKGLAENGFRKLPPDLDKFFGRAVDYSVGQRKLLNTFFAENELRVMVNAAGPSNVFESLSNPSEYMDFPWRQCAAQLSVLRDLPNPPMYVFISSGSIYGDTGVEGASEDFPPAPISPYAQGKLRAEHFLKNLSDSYAGGIIVLRCFSIYSDQLESRLPFVISTNMSKGDSFTLSGTGDEVRDFVHVVDVARAIESVINSKIEYSMFNVGTGIGVAVREVCQIAAEAFEVPYVQNETVIFNGHVRKSDPVNLVANLVKLQKLGFNPSVYPRDGLLRYFQLKRLSQ